MENIIGKVEEFMELGGKKKDIVFLVLGGLSPVSYTHLTLPTNSRV